MTGSTSRKIEAAMLIVMLCMSEAVRAIQQTQRSGSAKESSDVVSEDSDIALKHHAKHLLAPPSSMLAFGIAQQPWRHPARQMSSTSSRTPILDPQAQERSGRTTDIVMRQNMASLTHFVRKRSLKKSSMAALATALVFLRPKAAHAKSLAALAAPQLMGWAGNPDKLFDVLFGSLIAGVCGIRLFNKATSPSKGDIASGSEDETAEEEKKRSGLASLRRRFLAAFWFFRLSDWMQGPYFFAVYASKVFGGNALDESVVARLFLTGFATSAILGPSLGRLADSCGRKAGTLAFALFYALGALSTRANVLWVLFLGRIFGGIGTSLLEAAPEPWMVSEHMKNGYPASGIGETFSTAYFGNSILAILAGQIASVAASKYGPTGPFTLSTVFLAAGAAVVAATWPENTAAKEDKDDDNKKGGVKIKDAFKKMLQDKRIMSVAAVQALFEGAMYTFVLQWPPALINVMQGAKVPFGKVFSCLMAACMVGSSAFEGLVRTQPVEKIAAGMLGMSAVAMGAAAMNLHSLPIIVGAFLVFEAAVGTYFPSIGTMRSKYVPEEYGSVIRTLIGIPLNIIVVSVMLSAKRLGIQGSLGVSTGALTLALAAQLRLLREIAGDRKEAQSSEA